MTASLPPLRDDKIRASGFDRLCFGNTGCGNTYANAQRVSFLNEYHRRNTEMKREDGGALLPNRFQLAGQIGCVGLCQRRFIPTLIHGQCV